MLPNNPVVPLWAHCLGIYWPACHGSAPLTQQSPEMNSAAQIRAGSESLLLFGILEVIGYFQAWPFKKKKSCFMFVGNCGQNYVIRFETPQIRHVTDDLGSQNYRILSHIKWR